MRRLIVCLLLAVPLLAQNITKDRIGAHMRFLSSDLLEGRGTATRGYMLAAEYVAAQYESFGLERGANGSYFQSVPFRKITPDVAQSTITIGSTTLRFGDGFVSTGDPLQQDARADGEVVYAGYGISAPSQKYDDYRNIDVRGKIVAFFSGAPERFPNDVRAHYSSTLVKIENAAAHGAIGVLSLRTTLDETRSSWARAVRQNKLGAMNWIESGGAIHATVPQVRAYATLSRTGIEALFGSKKKIDDTEKLLKAGKAKSFELPVRASIHLIAKHENVASPNVVGIVRGSDPKLRNEYIVYSAHLDHLGISEPVEGDTINNGAFDNASGIAAILEIARMFATTKPRPKRSILFLATTGEEKGLRGADYFANNPTVPLSSIVADINVDEIFMFHPVRDVVAIGMEHSTLGDAAARVAKQMNVVLSPDPQPEEVVFVRSDQYPFVKRGVPSIYAGAGYKPVDKKHDIEAEIVKWEENIYHSPKDEMSQPMDLSVGVMVAKFNYLLGREVANAVERPRWKRGDFFGEMFGDQR